MCGTRGGGHSGAQGELWVALRVVVMVALRGTVGGAQEWWHRVSCGWCSGSVLRVCSSWKVAVLPPAVQFV